MFDDSVQQYTCPSCGHHGASTDEFCPIDGQRLQTVTIASGRNQREATSAAKWIAVVIVVIATVVITLPLLVNNTLRYQIAFKDGYGLAKGANVYVVGHVAGIVESLHMEGHDVIATIRVRRDVRGFLRQESVYVVVGEGLLQEHKCICVFQGTNPNSAEVPPNGRITGIGGTDAVTWLLKSFFKQQFEKVAWSAVVSAFRGK